MTDAGLARRLGVTDAVVIGLGSMLGAGVFVVFGPAAAAAGPALLVALGVAAIVAYCNATSSAQLAAVHPDSGGTYVYGRHRLGPGWGFLAGWAFVVGKTASCAAMAWTFGAYTWPAHPVVPAVAAVAVLTGVNYLGVTKTAGLSRILVVVTLLALAAVVAAGLGGGAADPGRLTAGSAPGLAGIGQAAALLFFAFAGYARIATLGAEVRDPARTIPLAIPLALGIVLAVYAVVAVTGLLTLGAAGLAAAPAPLAAVAASGSLGAVAPVVRIGAAVASAGVLLSLMAGIGRTTMAMARDGALPTALGTVHPRFRVPHRAEVLLGLVVAAVVATGDVRGVIGFSSFTVLVYYTITNAAAWTLGTRPRWLRPVTVLGALGCLTLAATLPVPTVLTGLGVLAVGLLGRTIRGRAHR